MGGRIAKRASLALYVYLDEITIAPAILASRDILAIANQT